MTIVEATPADAEEILALQRLCYRGEALLYDDFGIPPLTQTLEELRAELERMRALKLLAEGRIIGSVRGYLEDETCHVCKLIVHPAHQNRGHGRRLLAALEASFPDCARFELFTGYRSEKNLSLYRKAGYRAFRTERLNERVSLVHMEKRVAGAPG